MTTTRLRHELKGWRRNKHAWFAGVLIATLLIVVIGPGIVGMIAVCVGVIGLIVVSRIKALNHTAPSFDSSVTCPDCGYDLRGLGREILCPECGRVRERS